MSLISFLFFLIFNYLILHFYILFAKKCQIFSISNERSSHKGKVVSGAGIIFGFVFLFIFYTQDFNKVFIMSFVSVIILFFSSFLDDIFDFKFYYKLLLQIICLFFLIWSLGFNLIFFLPIFFYFLININVSNFMDGINGISFLYFFIFFLSLMIIDVKINLELFYTTNYFYKIILSGLLSFGFFNFRRKAVCFLGDVGSVSLGLLGSLCIIYYYCDLQVQNIINYPYLIFLLFFIYYLDSFFTLLKRFLSKKNIFTPHKEHVYQFLANNYLKSHLAVSVLYACLQLIINILVVVIVFSSNIILSKSLFVVLCFYLCMIIFSYFYIQKKVVKGNS